MIGQPLYELSEEGDQVNLVGKHSVGHIGGFSGPNETGYCPPVQARRDEWEEQDSGSAKRAVSRTVC